MYGTPSGVWITWPDSSNHRNGRHHAILRAAHGALPDFSLHSSTFGFLAARLSLDGDRGDRSTDHALFAFGRL